MSLCPFCHTPIAAPAQAAVWHRLPLRHPHPHEPGNLVRVHRRCLWAWAEKQRAERA